MRQAGLQRLSTSLGPVVLSVTAETAVRTTRSAHRSTLAEDADTRPTDGFSALVDSNVSAARDGAESHPAPERSTAPARDDGPSDPAASDKPSRDKAPAPKTPTALQGSSSQAATSGDTAAAGDAIIDVGPTGQSPAVLPSDAAAAALAAATTAGGCATGSDGQTSSPADGTDISSPDSQTDPTTSKAAPDAAVATLPAMMIAAVIQPPPSSQGDTAPAAAGVPQGSVGPTAAPGAIAAAAAAKAAADIATTTQPNGGTTPDTAVAGLAQDTAPPATIAAAPATSDAQGDVVATAVETPAQPDLGIQADPVAQTKAAAQSELQKAGPGFSLQAAANASRKLGAGDGVKATSGAADGSSPAANTPEAAADAAPKQPGTSTHETAGKSATSPAKADETIDPGPAPRDHRHTASVESGKPLQPTTLLDVSAVTPQAAAVSASPATGLQNTPLDASRLVVTTGTAVTPNAVAVEISAQAKAGNSRFEIRLDPPELGRIDVRLEVHRNGEVTSRLFVEKSETLDLLRRDAPQLQQALQDAGLKTGSNGLQFSLRDQGSQDRNDSNGNGQTPQRLVIAEDDAMPADTVGRLYGRPLGSSGGIDIRV